MIIHAGHMASPLQVLVAEGRVHVREACLLQDNMVGDMITQAQTHYTAEVPHHHAVEPSDLMDVYIPGFSSIKQC